MPFLTIAEAAAYLDLSPSILRRLEQTREFVPAIKTRSRHRRYSLTQCDAFQRNVHRENKEKTACYAFRHITEDNQESLMLAHQLTEWCEGQQLADFEVVVELAAGLNFRKAGFVRVMGMMARGEINHLVLVEPGSSLLFVGEPVTQACARNGIKLTVLQGDYPWKTVCH